MRLSKGSSVPADLTLLYEFVNSLDARRFVQGGVRHSTGDEFATPSQFTAWLRRRRLVEGGIEVGREAFHDAVELRDALRAFLQRQPARRGDAHTRARLNAAAARFPLVVQTSAAEGVVLRSPRRPTAGVGRILAQFHHAAATARLDRLKMCLSDECRWIFYDRSRPGTRRWCSSALCGNRHKTRAYRRRRRKARER